VKRPVEFLFSELPLAVFGGEDRRHFGQLKKKSCLLILAGQ
jgi:hypothetical protein